MCFLCFRRKLATALTSGSDSGKGPQYVSSQGCIEAPSTARQKRQCGGRGVGRIETQIRIVKLIFYFLKHMALLSKSPSFLFTEINTENSRLMQVPLNSRRPECDLCSIFSLNFCKISFSFLANDFKWMTLLAIFFCWKINSIVP